MLSNVKGLIPAGEARTLPIYCPETILLKASLDELLALTCKMVAYKGPDICALYYNKFVDIAAPHGISVQGKRVVDFGCGQARPLGLAILHHLSGAENVLAVDLQEISDQAAVSIAALTTIMATLCGRLKFNHDALGSSKQVIAARSVEYDLEKLLAYDLMGGIPNKIQFRQDYFQNLKPHERKFDILVSNSVFEHVHGIPEVLASMRESISDDGAMYIAIDYHDHRVYAQRNTASRWEYLMDGNDDNGDINCIRHTEFLRLIDEGGFDVIDCRRETGAPTAEERARFLPVHQNISDVDVETLAAHILLKPKRRKGFFSRFSGKVKKPR